MAELAKKHPLHSYSTTLANQVDVKCLNAQLDDEAFLHHRWITLLPVQQLLAEVGDGVFFPPQDPPKYCTNATIWCICLEDERPGEVQTRQYGGTA